MASVHCRFPQDHTHYTLDVLASYLLGNLETFGFLQKPIYKITENTKQVDVVRKLHSKI